MPYNGLASFSGTDPKRGDNQKNGKPIQLKLTWAKLEAHMPAGPIIEADTIEAKGALEGLAEIAWAGGWRPAGLTQHMADALRVFKALGPK